MDAAKAEALLCPNVDGFYKALTQLLILHQPSSSSSLAGVDWKATNAGLNSLTLKDIPIKFPRGFVEYSETFLPPLLVETLACLEQERSQGFSGNGSSGSSSNTKKLVTLDTYEPLRPADDQDGTNMFRLKLALPTDSVQLVDRDDDRRPDWGVGEGDLVMLTPSDAAVSSNWVIVGVVDAIEVSRRLPGAQGQGKENVLLHVHICRYSGKCRVEKKGAWVSQEDLMEAMGTQDKFTLTGLGSLTTSIREYQALVSVPHLPPKTRQWIFDPTAIKAPVSKPLAASDSSTSPSTISETLHRYLRSTLNTSQLQAVTAICRGSTTNMHLLQGPPGTGKTKTVLSILSAILAGGMEQSSRGKGKPAKVVPGACFASENGQQANAAGAKYGHKRVLVCAPSNAAVDEIIVRVKQQRLVDKDGRLYDPVVVRMGAPGGYGRQSSDRRAKLPPELEETSFHFKVQQLLRVSKGKAERVLDVREKVLVDAHLVFATLSGAGSKLLVDTVMRSLSKERKSQDPIHFDAVIVDEAAQAVEVSTLIPLKYQPDAMVLVGDPAQLEATLFSRGTVACKYGQSLFQRLQRGGLPFTFLNTQYRMHPEISSFISERFYGKLLSDAPEVTAESHAQPFHKLKEFRPFLFFNVEEGREEAGTGLEYSKDIKLSGNQDQLYQTGSSYYNMAEVDFIAEMYRRLQKAFPNENLNQRIGVIAPYRQQITELKKKLNREDVEVSTVDGFQGREKDIIIFTCVRAPRKGEDNAESGNGGGNEGSKSSSSSSKSGVSSIGFLSNWRRLNVALTRGKYALWMVGHAATLRKDDDWKILIDDFEKKSRIMTTDFMLKPPPQLKRPKISRPPPDYDHHRERHRSRDRSRERDRDRDRDYRDRDYRESKRGRGDRGPTPPPSSSYTYQPQSSYNPLLTGPPPPPFPPSNPFLPPQSTQASRYGYHSHHQPHHPPPPYDRYSNTYSQPPQGSFDYGPPAGARPRSHYHR